VLSLANCPQDVGDYLDADAYSPQSRPLIESILIESQFARLTGPRPRLRVEVLIEILVEIQFARLTGRGSSKRARMFPRFLLLTLLSRTADLHTPGSASAELARTIELGR
jgi:hypothetical protein